MVESYKEAHEPRQIRKEATVAGLLLCRVVRYISVHEILNLRATQYLECKLMWCRGWTPAKAGDSSCERLFVVTPDFADKIAP